MKTPLQQHWVMILSAATDEDAPAHWSTFGKTPSDAPLPDHIRPLSDFVRAPEQLARRLTSIGVVDRDAGDRLRYELKPGQRLVSRDGDFWRWDGFTAHSDAKTAAAIRLEQRNRLQVLERDFESAETRRHDAEAAHQVALEALKKNQGLEREARVLFSEARRALDTARATLTGLERDHERANARIASIDENLERLGEDKVETELAHNNLEEEKSALPRRRFNR